MASQQDHSNWELDKLSDHIVDTHHVYARKASAEIKAAGDQLAKAHGAAHPELVEITKTFDTLAQALEEHMAGEEKYLFPYVKKLLAAKRGGNKLPKPGFGSLETPLKHHYEDHDHAAGLMGKIRDLSNGYAAPAGADGAHRTFYDQLKAFAQDLKEHIHVENDVLFGRCVQLEKEVTE